uniref:Uncharacterized protein n=1 Tax=Rhizophora mucronata TaxID=61149 RepID=A0A2P2PHM8_RHIMU
MKSTPKLSSGKSIL